MEITKSELSELIKKRVEKMLREVYTENIIKLIDEIDDELRLEIIKKYCPGCGKKDTSCRCWDDS